MTNGTTWACRYISGKQAGTNVPAVNNPMWQAPEVISNPGKCSKPGDVYSFGIILWEFLMMRRPWQGTPLMFIQHLVQGGKRPEVPGDLSEVPTSRPGEVLWGVEEYVRLMQRCWDADPDVRPNFEQVVEELESIEKGANTRMYAPRPPARMNGMRVLSCTAWPCLLVHCTTPRPADVPARAVTVFRGWPTVAGRTAQQSDGVTARRAKRPYRTPPVACRSCTR